MFNTKNVSLICLANGGRARGVSYKNCPSQCRAFETAPSSFSQDFLHGLDELMQTLAGSNPHFISCVKVLAYDVLPLVYLLCHHNCSQRCNLLVVHELSLVQSCLLNEAVNLELKILSLSSRPNSLSYAIK